MSVQIGRTVGGKLIAWLFAIIAVLAVLATVSMRAHAADPPAPVVSFTKACESPGANVVYCTITVTNTSPVIVDDGDSETSEDNGTGALLVQDFLPEDGSWFVLDAKLYDGDAAIDPTALECVNGDGIIACNIPDIRGLHINEAVTAFVNGKAEIVTYGVLSKCGSVTNTAVLLGLSAPRYTSASATYPCPATATPTSVPPTATPTAIAPTSTPAVIVVTATPTKTPIAFIPKPPATGNTSADDKGEDRINVGMWLLVALGLSTMTLIVVGTLMSRRR